MPRLADYLDALHPAVLRLVRQVVEAAHQYGKWAGVCGEVAADPLAVPVLVGVGGGRAEHECRRISRAPRRSSAAWIRRR